MWSLQRNAACFLALFLSSPTVSLAANSVIINEIMIDPKFESQPYGEWFELYNNDTVNDVDLTGWSFSSTSSADNVTILGSIGDDNNASYVIAAGGYLVLGNNADTVADAELNNFTLDFVYGSSAVAFYETAGSLYLYDANGNLHDSVSWNSTDTFAIPSGASVALIESDTTVNDMVNAHWCASISPYGAGDMGTPGQANDCNASVPLSPNNNSAPIATTAPTMAPPLSDNSGNPPTVPAITAPTNAPVAANTGSDSSSSSFIRLSSGSMLSVFMVAFLAVIL